MDRGWIKTVPLAILFASVTASHAQWSQPAQEITQGIYTLLAKDGELFAGTDGQGAFRSGDRGVTWETANEGFPTLPGVYTFAEFGGRLFAGTYDGVYFSADRGSHWTRSNHDGWRFLHVVALAGNGRFLFATSNREFRYPFNGGLFRSADSGMTWTPVNNGFTATIWINTLVQHGGTLYVGTSGEGLFRSADNGESWTPINQGIPPVDFDTRFLFSSGGKLYLGTTDGVYVLSNGKNSWTRSSRGMPANQLINAFAAYENHLFAGSGQEFGGGVFHSSDGGASWRRVGRGEPQPIAVAALAVLGNELFASTGEVTCGELGCNGSAGGVWKVSIPRLLGLPTAASRESHAGHTPWRKAADPLEAFDAAGRRMAGGPHSIPFRARGLSANPAR